jgi:hypothetical protein
MYIVIKHVFGILGGIVALVITSVILKKNWFDKIAGDKSVPAESGITRPGQPQILMTVGEQK